VSAPTHSYRPRTACRVDLISSHLLGAMVSCLLAVRFFEGGYVIARGLFSPEQLDALSQWGDEMPFVDGPIQ
jgi:hypothetical protein